MGRKIVPKDPGNLPDIGPIVATPLRSQSGLPIGVQIISAPWREADALRVAASLERLGITNAEAAYG